MGQEAGKPAWPRPVGGYQTITDRRYGRRHACVGFRPSLNSRDRGEHQHNGDSEHPPILTVHRENFLCSSPIFQVSPGLLDKPLSENTGTGEPICRSVSTQTFEGNTSSFSLFPYGLESRQISWNSVNTYGKTEDLTEYASGEHNDLNDQNGIAFVNIDSYKPDSSDGEEDDAQDSFSLAREEAGVFRGTLDNMLSELVKDSMPFSDFESQLSALDHSISRECCEAAGPMPLMTYYSDLACSNNRTFKLSAEDQAMPKSNPSDVNYEIQQMQSIVDAGFRTPISIANEFNVNDGKIDEGSLPGCVVRPKIRKQNTTKQLERVKLLPNGGEESEFAEVQQSRAECGSKEEMSSSIFFDSRDYGGHRGDREIDLRKNAAAQEQKSALDFWDEFEDCRRHLPVSHRDEYSLEWSDGEWSTTVSAYFTATEKGQSSSDESWATVPDKEEGEPEVQSSSSGVEEENTNFFFQGGQQAFRDASLEEGEIPWLQYRGGVESSSDEENDLVSDFMRPGFFLLDGNNNLEDDSSVSEDLDVEWRLLDEFDGLGLAQAFPYVNPQYLAFVAIEEHLQQTMENALAHLESLGVEVEQAHPPATKETIECLPQIIVTDDHNGQEQRCTVCCSEYVKDEIMTELPCHHLFHKPCVTLWLQESGTCPVCRHVLAPVLPEAAAANVPFLSNHDSASSVHSATGASD